MLYGREHFYPMFRERVDLLAKADPVLDLGTNFRYRKELKPFAKSFGPRYVAMGYHSSSEHGDRNVHVDGDIHALPFATGSAGGIFCLEVLEHLHEPQAAIDEMHRVLRPGAHLLLTTPFMAPFHASPGTSGYHDFFRYTDDGLRLLMRRFSKVEVEPFGGLPYRLLSGLVPLPVRHAVLSSGLAMRVFNALDSRLPTRSPLRWLAWATR
ncbi:MAG TPA: methyltransferase domain-containing protein [Longimicrobium sp.]|jgi:SAM-dependent methyltransferase|uniref:class I SAM-dependent methyltransferase n=1 Tax=Longimicrobium sp. TaxID=2029185 RepID=UPI002ED7C2AE